MLNTFLTSILYFILLNRTHYQFYKNAPTVILRQVSREGDYLVFVEKKGLLTTQNGTQQITERRVRLGGTDLNTLEELGF